MNQRQWRLLLPPLVFGIVSFFWSVHITSTPPHDEEGFIISAASIRSGAGLLRFASKMWTCRHNKCKHQQNRETTCPRGGVVSARHTRPHAPCFPGEEVKQEYHHKELYEHGDCIPMQRWQTQSYPNCNSFHELSMMAARLNSTNTTGASMQQIAELHVHYLGKGSVRTAWKVDFGSGIGTAVVLKTLK